MRYLKVTLLALTLSGLAAACGDRYRYPCQDPDKANKMECACGADGLGRTKNKALNAVESGATTTTLRLLAGFDC
jgi:hypothetical protein